LLTVNVDGSEEEAASDDADPDEVLDPIAFLHFLVRASRSPRSAAELLGLSRGTKPAIRRRYLWGKGTTTCRRSNPLCQMPTRACWREPGSRSNSHICTRRLRECESHTRYANKQQYVSNTQELTGDRNPQDVGEPCQSRSGGESMNAIEHIG
jgi:hypothetical protein